MSRADLNRHRANLEGEIDGAALYDALARTERDPNLSDIYRRLATTERAHAEIWRAKLAAAGIRTHDRLSPRAAVLVWLAERFGAGLVAPLVAGAEASDSRRYAGQPDAEAVGLAADERSHARVMRAAADVGGASGASLARLEGRHRSGGGNALRAAVLGANDGLVSNLSLVMGVAGANADSRMILLTGLAGLVAGACSMAMGEWLSVSSSRELAQSQIRAEASELEASPAEEQQELTLIYQSKGMEEPAARALAAQMFATPEGALDALTREELGIDPDNLGGSAWTAAGFSFVLFAFGAIVPVLPFMIVSGATAAVLSVVVSGAALATIGAGTSLFTGRSFVSSAVRQLAIGYAAAGLTFGVGKLVGVSLG